MSLFIYFLICAIYLTLSLSKASAYNLLSNPTFPTLRIGGRKLVLKQDLIAWLKNQTKTKPKEDDQ